MAVFAAPDGRQLHYEDEGQGPAILCLAGLSRNLRDFAHIPAHLPGHRVIRLSARGRGGSAHAEDPMAEYQVPVEVGDALALIDHLGLTGVGVLGTSRGGIVGMVMAATRPGLVTALALNDVGAAIEVAGLLRIAGYVGTPPEAKTFAEAAAAMQAAHAADFPGVPITRWEGHARAVFGEGPDGAPVLSYDPALATATLGALDPSIPQIDLSPLFAACAAIPVLTIRGALSDVLSAETLKAMATQHPDFTALTIADRGHAPFLDEPEAIAALRIHFERTPSP
jgi:pimeloyl-ACP methyl ester carboxylesterase